MRKKPIVKHSRMGDEIVGWVDVATGKRVEADKDEKSETPKKTEKTSKEL